MEHIAEIVEKTMNQLNDRKSSEELEKKSKIIKQCVICNKDYEQKGNWDCIKLCGDPECEKESLRQSEQRQKENEEKNLECEKIYRAEKEEEEILAVGVKIKYYIPPKYHDIYTDKKELLEKELENNLFLWGKVGTGKTVFACSILKHYCQMGVEIKFINYTSFIMKLQSLFKQDGNPYSEAEEIAKFPGILCIDDLGAAKLTDYVRQITYYIINEREQQELPIIITSNYSLDDIDKFIDTRISSRIVGICKILNFKGEDQRLRNT